MSILHGMVIMNFLMGRSQIWAHILSIWFILSRELASPNPVFVLVIRLRGRMSMNSPPPTAYKQHGFIPKGSWLAALITSEMVPEVCEIFMVIKEFSK